MQSTSGFRLGSGAAARKRARSTATAAKPNTKWSAVALASIYALSVAGVAGNELTKPSMSSLRQTFVQNVNNPGIATPSFRPPKEYQPTPRLAHGYVARSSATTAGWWTLLR